MGCNFSNEWYKNEMVKLCEKSEQEVKYMIEQIIINTNFNEKEIYYLYLKFERLDAEEGLISNSQLLELPEFKFCPFKNHLIRVFKLEEEGELIKPTDRLLDVVSNKEVEVEQHELNSINEVDKITNFKKINNDQITLHQVPMNSNF